MPESVKAKESKVREKIAPASSTAKPGEPSVVEPTADQPAETGGPSGPEPTRYGDWERKGRCIDF